jgi:3-hydroxymyristoyl/3-hydroxydecanoyl-(acyl carrier protein) dehydratases
LDKNSATGHINVVSSKFYFDGHYPGQPVFPGVLIVEAFGQTAAALSAHSLDPKEIENKLVF